MHDTTDIDLPAQPSGTPTPKSPTLPGEHVTIRRLGDPELEGPAVYIFHDVAEEVLFGSRYRHSQCAAGLLIGGYFEGPAGNYVEVRGFDESTIVDTPLEFFDHLRKRWKMAVEQLAEEGMRPVGWFASRPDSKGRPNAFEAMTHRSFFNHPYQVLWVLDPVSQTAGLYQQRDGFKLQNIGFSLIEARSQPKKQSSEVYIEDSQD